MAASFMLRWVVGRVKRTVLMRGRSVLGFFFCRCCVCFIDGHRVSPSCVGLSLFKKAYLRADIVCQQNGVQTQGVWQIMVIIWKYGWKAINCPILCWSNKAAMFQNVCDVPNYNGNVLRRWYLIIGKVHLKNCSASRNKLYSQILNLGTY